VLGTALCWQQSTSDLFHLHFTPSSWQV